MMHICVHNFVWQVKKLAWDFARYFHADFKRLKHVYVIRIILCGIVYIEILIAGKKKLTVTPATGTL